MLTWEKGPLGQPATPDWTYWTPQTPEGLWRAWFHPNGLHGSDNDRLLGDDLLTVEAAQELCEQHSVGVGQFKGER
jgi:hypothetical protein